MPAIDASTCGRAHQGCGGVPALIEKIRFARDSPLEGSGFELSVPRQMGNGFEALSETGPIGYRRRGLIRAVAGFAEYPD
jgi:hypothetical protein